ncbi:cobyrinic acid a,c-diamide synthase [Rhodovibrio sodomensis]|uniref:Cobyrinic acid a,c-diamide synthase n=2 Tax=Rhodovibrio sodomensis TaxID=1088 RepID=A0ABS1DE71_9PROT|nr:cobyrinic acid a,c-diamide synthase [Rhodovibrio sodomensis]
MPTPLAPKPTAAAIPARRRPPEGAARMPAPLNVIAVASGKGGVGKTWLAITLTQALSTAGQKALLFDGDLGLANVDVQLGLNPAADLSRALAGQESLDDVLLPVEATGFHVAAGRSGSGGLAALSAGQLDGLGRSVVRLAGTYDRVVMDLGAGIDATVRTLASYAGVSLVVTTDEPTALTDAYAYIKVIRQHRPDADLRVVVNMAASQREGERTHTTLRKACESFLGFNPPLAGVIRRDTRVREAIRAQKPLLTRSPNCQAAVDVTRLAQQLLG